MRIGTRGSALALAQANWVAARLGPDAEIVPIVTSGDRRRAVDDKREWVLELDEALLRGDVDLTVHSAKDVPVERPEGVRMVSVPPRANPHDVLVGASSLDSLRAGARVGTSSLRRVAQLLGRRPDVEAVELRGNVDTRLRKLADGEADALILAAAGLERLGRSDVVGAVLDFVPAAGQGALLIEGREQRRAAGGGRALGDPPADGPLASLTDPVAWSALAGERAFVAALEADCGTPVAAYLSVAESGWYGRAFVGAVDGSMWLTDELLGDDPVALGTKLAERLLAAGANDVLGRS